MREEFTNYLNKIGLSKTLISAITGKYEILTQIIEIVDFDEIFVSEKISTINGEREYFSLWCFTGGIIAKSSITKKKIEVYKLKDYISFFEITDSAYDYTSAKRNSSLSVQIRRINAESPLSFYSSGINCDQLLKIVHTYFIVNIKS
jgi:hypothetical protein